MCARIVTPVHPRAKARWTRRRRFFAEDDVLNSILDDARWFASTGGRFCPRAARKETKKIILSEGERRLFFRFLKGPKTLSFLLHQKDKTQKTDSLFISLSLFRSFHERTNATPQKKKWEKQELNQNGKPARVKMHVKTNDKVIVIAGADKGKVTEVVEVFTKNGSILCKDVNIKTKHVKPMNEGESGSIIQREFPIHHSNVMHYSPAEKKRSRVGKKMEGDKKVRYLKSTGEVLAH